MSIKSAKARKLYIGNLNLIIKKIDPAELSGPNTTKQLRKKCSLNMPMNFKTVKSKRYVFVSAPKHVCDKLHKLNEINFYGSQIKIEDVKSIRGQTNIVSSPAKNQPIVVNKI